MSAANWIYCPKCQADVEDRREEFVESWVNQEMPDDLKFTVKAEARRAFDKQNPPSLSECYEIGLWYGGFKASYKARCKNCHWGYEFMKEEEVISSSPAWRFPRQPSGSEMGV